VGRNPILLTRARWSTIFGRLKIRWRYACQLIRIGVDERSPVGPNEFVLRRIYKDAYKPELPTPIVRTGFTPSPSDTDGLSVHREIFISPKSLAFSGRKPGEYVIVRLRVADLMGPAFRFTLQASSNESAPPGHALIPEMKYSAERVEKNRVEKIARELSKIGSESIAYIPPGLLKSATPPK